MRRAILLIMVATAALLAASGVALAITKTCKVGVVCKGTLNNDVLTGTKRADTIKALAGADTIRALGANDRLDGGDGDDTYAFGARWGKDVIAADTSGTDTADFSTVGGGSTIDVDLTTTAGSEASDPYHGTVNWPGSVIENVNGSADSDFVKGSAAANVLRGNAGDDDLSGKFGDDSLYAGDGSDWLDGGDGDDTLEAGGGGRPGAFDDTLAGGAGNDTITDTGAGSPDEVGDILEGGAGNDTLRAGADGDSLEGNAGNDTLYGQGGDDIYSFGQGWGTDEIVDTDVNDFIQFHGDGTTVSTNVTVDMAAGTATDGTNVLTFPGTRFYSVQGGEGDDTITGNAVPNFVGGEGGDDVIDVAGGGQDGVICGYGNNDRVRYDSSDTIYVGCEHLTRVP